MRQSTTVRYGTRIVVCLASHAGSMTRGEIAEAEEIPSAYTDKILQQLKMAGIVRSRRGPSGGYELCDGALKLTVADVCNALGGAVHLAPCEERPCPRKDQCRMTTVWERATQALNDELSSWTVEELARDPVPQGT